MNEKTFELFFNKNESGTPILPRPRVTPNVSLQLFNLHFSFVAVVVAQVKV
jgi:hypothetical protein